MPKCPSCDAVLEQDFGMVTCPSCQSVLMVDISGQVQMASDDPDPYDGEDFEDFSDDSSQKDFQNPSDEPDQGEELFSSEQEFNDDSGEPTFEEEINWDDSSQSGNEDENDISGEAEGDFVDLDAQEPMENLNDEDGENNPAFDHFQEDPPDSDEEIVPLEPPADEESSADPDVFEENQQEPSRIDEDEESPEEFPMAAQADPNPVDVTEFANSEESNLEEGELMYDIFISRIDSKDLRDEVKFVLMDEKLKLNHGEYMRKIKGGKLTVPDLNPIKAKRVVEQLQYSDLDIKWRQKRVIIETVEPEEDFDEGEGVEGEEADL